MQLKIIKAHRSARTSAAVLITLTSCTIWLRNPISNSSCHVPYLLHSFLYLTRSGNRVRKRCLSLGCHGGEAAVADTDHVYLYTWVCVSGSASVENLFFSVWEPKMHDLILAHESICLLMCKRAQFTKCICAVLCLLAVLWIPICFLVCSILCIYKW